MAERSPIASAFVSFAWALGCCACFGLLLVVACLAFGDIVHEGPVPDASKVEIEMAIWEAAAGREPFLELAKAYEEANRDRNVRVKVTLSPGIDNLIKPRVLMGNPPEIAHCGVNVWHLLRRDKLHFLDAMLDGPSYDDPSVTFRDTFLPGALDAFRYEGRTYGMPFTYLVWVIWYDRKLFREHGWEPPETWDEMLALCARIRSESDVAPFAYQGKDIGFAYWFLMSLAQRCGGVEVVTRLNNIEPGAFVQPAFVEAAGMLQELAGRYFQTGYRSMGRLEGQMQFINRKCAMLYCGNWLVNEMRNVTPEDFELACFPVPAVLGPDGRPRADANVHNSIWGGQTILFADANHPAAAGDLMRFWFSRERMLAFSRATKMITPIRGGTDESEFTPAQKDVMAIIRATTGTFTDRCISLYPKWIGLHFNPALEQLLEGAITPKAFGQRLEETVEQAVRRNPNVYKPPPLAVKNP